MRNNHAPGRESDMHDSAIESIAVQYHMDKQEIRAIYEAEMDKLKLGCRIKSFLPVLCVRHVKERLMHYGRSR